MNTNTQPIAPAVAEVEAQVRAKARELVSMTGYLAEAKAAVVELRWELDVAVATSIKLANQLTATSRLLAERDKRIAELERYVSELEDVCDITQLQKAQHAAKQGGSHE